MSLTKPRISARTIQAIEDELVYQDMKWGADKQQSFPGYLAIMRKELQESEDGWMKSIPSGRHSALAELIQVVATGIRCLEEYGLEGCPYATWDTPPK